MNESFKLARMKARSEERQQLLRTVADIAKNPVVEWTAAMILIAWMESFEFEKGSGNHILEGPEALISRAGISGIIAAQQLAPLIPYAAPLVGDMLKGTVPLLGAVAGAV